MMTDEKNSPQDIDEYIAGFPEEVQALLDKLRQTILEAAPEAEETIKYGISTFTLEGTLVHFAGYKKHIGFYPEPSGIEEFRKELSAYKSSKGSVQFPLDKPIPYDLIREIVKFRMEENIQRAGMKKNKKK